MNVSGAEFKAAGVLFTDGTQFLAGLQTRKGQQVFDGFGGAREPDEDVLTTAYRETLEEMLEPENLTPAMVEKAKEEIKPQTIKRRGSYMLVVCELSDITNFLKVAKDAEIKTPLYETLPKTLEEFMSQRQATNDAEISELILVTRDYTEAAHPLTNSFVGDIESLFKIEEDVV